MSSQQDLSNKVAPLFKEQRVAIVVVSYNSSKDLARLLDSLAGLQYEEYQLIVVDNQSSEFEIEKVQLLAKEKNFELVLNSENGGFAAGNNIGLKKAIAEGVDYIWLLNADTVVEPETLSKLIQASNDTPMVSCWGSRVLQGEPSEDPLIWSLGGVIDEKQQEVSMEGAGTKNSVWDKKDKELLICDYVPGCSMFFARDLVDKVGYMPEEYFMYFEETAWCDRMAKENLILAICPGSIVWHCFDESKTETWFHTYYYNRNSFYFWSEVGGISTRLRLKAKVLLKKLPAAIWAWYKAPDPHYKTIFSAHVLASFHFVLGISGRRHKG